MSVVNSLKMADLLCRRSNAGTGSSQECAIRIDQRYIHPKNGWFEGMGRGRVKFVALPLPPNLWGNCDKFVGKIAKKFVGKCDKFVGIVRHICGVFAIIV